jgi:serine protease Do
MPKNLLSGEAGSHRDSSEAQTSKTDALDGVEVADLDSKTRRQFDVPPSIKGVVVASVDPNSNSAEAGLRAGDIIVEMNREPVTSAEAAVQQSEKINSRLEQIWRRWRHPVYRGG